MNYKFQTKLSSLLLMLTLFTLAGCSVVDSYRVSSQSPAALPKIPEIKRQQAAKPRITPPKKAVARSPVKTRKQVNSSSYQIKNKPVVVKPKQTEQQRLEEKQRLQKQAQKNATVEIDPYENIPENSTEKTKAITVTPSSPKTLPASNVSPAVKSLMTSARADIAIGRSRSAISKLERGLRIEPENAKLWSMLAKAHYSNSAYLHSISIAKKSNANTNDEDLIKQNWQLIKQAGERSGNASAIKEALDYIKLNP